MIYQGLFDLSHLLAVVLCITFYRAVGTGGQGGMRHPIIVNDLNVPFFKSRICKFSEPHSFLSRKLLTSTNIQLHSLRSVKN